MSLNNACQRCYIVFPTIYKRGRIFTQSLISILRLVHVEMVKSLFLLVLFVNLALADKSSNKVTFMLDFLKSQTKPTNLVVWRNCFDERQKVDLVGKNSFTPIVFSKQDSLNESDFRENPQYCLFILDLTCFEAPERIILKVNIRCSRFYYCFCNNRSFSFHAITLTNIHTHTSDRHSTHFTSLSMDYVCRR